MHSRARAVVSRTCAGSVVQTTNYYCIAVLLQLLRLHHIADCLTPQTQEMWSFLLPLLLVWRQLAYGDARLGSLQILLAGAPYKAQLALLSTAHASRGVFL